MHSDEMNKIELRNVENIRFLPFSMEFSFRWETIVFLFLVQFSFDYRMKIGYHMQSWALNTFFVFKYKILNTCSKCI